jgi:hypothetical protein
MCRAMTAREFVVCGGNACPRCGSEEVDWGSLTVEGQSTFQDGTCQADGCGARFYTISRLVGFGASDNLGRATTETISEDFGEIVPVQEGAGGKTT